jgi:hypothetical protein
MALMDDVKKSLQSGFQLPQFGQSERLERLQRASTGRLVKDTGPAATSLAEQVAASAAEQQKKEDVLAGQMQAEQLSQEEEAQWEEFRQKNKQIDEQVLNARQDMQNKVDNILQEYSQRTGELVMKQESAKTQYALALMRLSNDDYLDKLETEAAASRLHESTAFEWELTRSIFEDELDLLRNDLSFRASIAADERTFKEYLTEMSEETAIQLAMEELEAEQTLQKYEAWGQLASGAARAGKMAYENLSEEESPQTFGGQGPLEEFRTQEFPSQSFKSGATLDETMSAFRRPSGGTK